MFRANCVIFLLMFCVFQCGTATAQEMNWLNAHERGSLKSIDSASAPLFAQLKKADRSWGVVQSHRRMNAGHDHFATFDRDICVLSVKVINLERALKTYWNSQPLRYKAEIPSALRDYHQKMEAAIKIASRYPNLRNCNELNHSQKMEFVRAVHQARTSRSNVSSNILGRRSATYKWSNTFAIELSPIPLKVEFLEGSAKLKISRSAGPLKFDFQTGPKVRQQSASRGLTTLIIRTPDNKQRIFDIEGIHVEFDVPASTIEIDGPKMTITCSTACLRELQS